MLRLRILMEQNGESKYVGNIVGNDSTDACFSYANEYLENPDNRAISISLPLSEKAFDVYTSKMAMKRFDDMSERFSDALKAAAQELRQMGLKGIDDIYDMIIKKRLYLSEK